MLDDVCLFLFVLCVVLCIGGSFRKRHDSKNP